MVRAALAPLFRLPTLQTPVPLSYEPCPAVAENEGISVREQVGHLHARGVLGIKDIRESPDILEKIRWEVTQRIVMEPRYQSRAEDRRKSMDISGYMFYIESQCSPPALMLMKVGRTDITSTVGKIDEIPQTLIQNAIDHPAEEPSYGMYANTDEIREWLKKELTL